MLHYFTEIGRPGHVISFENSDSWHSINSNHILTLTQIDPFPSGHYLIFNLSEVTMDGVVGLSTVSVEKDVDAYAYSNYGPDTTRFTLGLVSNNSTFEQMVLVEETDTDIYFVIYTGKIYGENGWIGRQGNDGRTYAAGFTYSSIALIPIRYNKSAGLCSFQSTSEKFTRWSDYVFVPESGGINIIGDRPYVSSSNQRTVTDPFAAEHPIVDLQDGTFLGAWVGGGNYDSVLGTSVSDYYGWFQIRWQWNSGTKSIDIVDERTVTYDGNGGEIFNPSASTLNVPDGGTYTGGDAGGGDVIIFNYGRAIRYDPSNPVGTGVWSHPTVSRSNGGLNRFLAIGYGYGRFWDVRFDSEANTMYLGEVDGGSESNIGKFVFTGRSITSQERTFLDVSAYTAYESATRPDGSYFRGLTVTAFEKGGALRFYDYFGEYVASGGSTSFLWSGSWYQDGSVKDSEGLEVTAEWPNGVTTDAYTSGTFTPAPLMDYEAGWGFGEGFPALLPNGEKVAVFSAVADYLSSYALTAENWRFHAFLFYPVQFTFDPMSIGGRTGRMLFKEGEKR